MQRQAELEAPPAGTTRSHHAPPRLRLSRRRALVAAATGFTAPLGALNVYGAAVYGFRYPQVTDAAVYYGAATIGLRFGWAHIYDAASQAAVWPGLHIYQTTWIQSPVAAWLFAPLTSLSLSQAFDLWAPLMFLMLGLTWWLLSLGSVADRIGQLTALVALWGVGIGMSSGQLVFLVGACIAIAWWLLRKGRQGWAGMVLAFAIAVKPQSAMLVPPALLLAGYRRAFVTWAACSLMVAVVAAVILTPDGLLQLLVKARSASSDPRAWNAVPGMSFAGLLGAGVLATVLQAAAAAGSLVVAWKARWAGPELPIASALVGSHLLTPYLHEPEVFMIAVAAMLFMRSGPGLPKAMFPVALWLAAEVAHIPVVGYAPLLVLEVLWLPLMATVQPQPPAIAPTMRNGSLPLETSSGSGSSGDVSERSSSHAKNLSSGLRFFVLLSRIVPMSGGYLDSSSSRIERCVTGP
ncbi:MAG TPA: glycosyltransferase family 87 protein, partial [Candidatus Udaeobacter sp.]|nr:glycosyltransferase family 87 protein [Candidatus Udaeobacter sp.]